MNFKMNIIGKNVKKYGLKAKLTQQQLCDKLDLYGLNLYHSDIYLIKYGKRIVRDYEALAPAKIFDISLDKIYEGTEKKLN